MLPGPARGLPGQAQGGGSSGLIAALMGLVDSRGPQGVASRGTPVYQGVSNAPRVGTRGQQQGFAFTPNQLTQEAIARRLAKVRQAGKPNTKVLQGSF
jgi:hypothetical protein